MGAGSQMDEDIGFIMAQSSSTGRLNIMGQNKLPWDVKANIDVQMANADPNQAHYGLSFTKDLDGASMQYQY
jgi:hypothetical protein